MPQVIVNDFAMNCDLQGPPDASCVILSHSVTTNLHMWDAQAAAISQRYRVLRYDTRGHGGSEAPEGPYDFSMLVSDVIGLMDAHEIEAAHFVGLSLGGMTALGLGIDHGDRIKSITVCNARADAPPEFGAAWDQRIALARSKGMAGLVEPTIDRWFTEDFTSNHPATVQSIREMIKGTDVDGYVACAQALKGLDYLKSVDSINIPALLIAGAQDQGAPESVMRALHGSMPGSQYVVLDPAGHISNLEQTEQFNHAVLSFLDSHSAN